MKSWPTVKKISAWLSASVALGCASAYADMTPRQTQLLVQNCVQCHSNPHIGAPLMGDMQVWGELAKEKGEEGLLHSVIFGLKEMPPLGKCSSCSEEDFRAMVRLMANLPTPEKKAQEVVQAGDVK
ncbi:hypothetical protein R50073_06810 [Maricurvus nonylphenolicus]|uniref:c-type cytochrome n=1 Tax=Maricurvus nonylphenolicus TaxID=1008307 RepID=UPI0036F1B115